uniref:Uncharacterized protein n=1 Tax=viral metagenome TaxID=1070528 RepID=A0A6M3LW62_9ZZZZ
MNKLNDEERKRLDQLVDAVDHYRWMQFDSKVLEFCTKQEILKLLKERDIPLKTAYTSGNRRICFDGDIVKIERQPR